jgi:hypothetical protein
MKYSKLEQIELGTPVHAPFKQLEPIHVSFQRSITPRKRESGKDSGLIALDACDKGGQFDQLARRYPVKPVLQRLAGSFSQHVHEGRDHLVSQFRPWAGFSDQTQFLLLLLIQVVELAQKEPGRRFGREVLQRGGLIQGGQSGCSRSRSA